MNTREKILAEALTLFSQKGFDAVSVRDIARAVGVKESSLYNHFANKQAIFDSILQGYTEQWNALFAGLPITDAAGAFHADAPTVEQYRSMTVTQFEAMADTLFDAYMTDDVNVKVRKMLTMEQYRSRDIGALFKQISFGDSLAYQEALFARMMEAGLFDAADPKMLALAFFAPVFLLFYQYGDAPEQLEEARELFRRHLRHFRQTYGAKAPREE
ncbi:MAG: TetR/AcrR family transcriptional regulator [Candidatus Limiplasma sp.]|nr:TetR/AcrR family transcriptional regulator [Candidatus Limiplasma sp.]